MRNRTITDAVITNERVNANQSSNATAVLQGSLFKGTAPAPPTAVLANVVDSPNINCGASSALLVNGQPYPCYNTANFVDPTNDFSTQRRNQFRGPGYF